MCRLVSCKKKKQKQKTHRATILGAGWAAAMVTLGLEEIRMIKNSAHRLLLICAQWNKQIFRWYFILSFKSLFLIYATPYLRSTRWVMV